jgi:polyvinyl alcohol dehydrogenase (cytochrome)
VRHGLSRILATAVAVLAALATAEGPAVAGAPAAAPAWTTYGGSNARAGAYPEPTTAGLRLAWRSLQLDGQVYAEPIWQGERVYVATENDSVYALGRRTGRVIWRRHLGTPVPLSDLPCGDINPLGITGTPVIVSGRLYVAAERLPLSHRLFALSLQTGRVLASWSLDLHLPGSDPAAQQQRAALTALGGAVYVPLGGLWGDCGQYVGQVIGVRPGHAPFAYRVPTAREGAIWAPAGLSVGYGGDLYAATGNSASKSAWDGGDSVLRLTPVLRLRGYFAPSDFAYLNSADLDLGSTAPLPLPDGRLFQIGKAGIAYLLAAGQLGGVGHPLASAPVCAGAYGGDAYAGGLVYVPCTDGLVALRAGPRALRVAWRSAGWDAGPPAVGGDAVFSVNEGTATLEVLSAASGRSIAQAALGSVPHFDGPTLAPGMVVVSAGRRVDAFALRR